MRLRHLFLWDMRFQGKYGFYLLYGLLTILYIVILFALPQAWRGRAAALLIFSDPAAMGLFFMGAIVLLEKSQRVPCAFAASPILAAEYVVSKTASLCLSSLIVAAILAIAAGLPHLPQVLLGTALSGILFTLLGMILATKITSLNQFILFTVPVEIACFVPAVLHLFQLLPTELRNYPANVCMDMIAGKGFTAVGILLTVAVIIILFYLAEKCVLKMWGSAGGVKL